MTFKSVLVKGRVITHCGIYLLFQYHHACNVYCAFILTLLRHNIITTIVSFVPHTTWAWRSMRHQNFCTFSKIVQYVLYICFSTMHDLFLYSNCICECKRRNANITLFSAINNATSFNKGNFWHLKRHWIVCCIWYWFKSEWICNQIVMRYHYRYIPKDRKID